MARRQRCAKFLGNFPPHPFPSPPRGGGGEGFFYGWISQGRPAKAMKRSNPGLLSGTAFGVPGSEHRCPNLGLFHESLWRPGSFPSLNGHRGQASRGLICGGGRHLLWRRLSISGADAAIGRGRGSIGCAIPIAKVPPTSIPPRARQQSRH
jgi:hypothetical protein